MPDLWSFSSNVSQAAYALSDGGLVDSEQGGSRFSALQDELTDTLVQAKILRMSRDPAGAIAVLQDGLKPERVHTFTQGTGLVGAICLTSRGGTQLIYDTAHLRTRLDSAVSTAIQGGCRAIYSYD